MEKTLLVGLPALWNIPAWCRAVFSNQKHPFLQFLRYAIAGVAAMGTNLGLFILCERVLFHVPSEVEALEMTLYDLGALTTTLREDPRVVVFIKSNVVAFLGANIVAYVLNFMWVFESGRHSRSLEIVLFLGVSFFAFFLATILASIAIHHGIDIYVAKGADILTAIVVNYVCRKCLIFKG